MAKIVLGMGSSHGPMLSTPPEEWGQRVLADKKNKEHYYKGKTWTYDQLVEARKSENLGNRSSCRSGANATRPAARRWVSSPRSSPRSSPTSRSSSATTRRRSSATPIRPRSACFTARPSSTRCSPMSALRRCRPASRSQSRGTFRPRAPPIRARPSLASTHQVAGGRRVRCLDPHRAPARRDATRVRLHLSADHARPGGTERPRHPQHVLSA